MHRDQKLGPYSLFWLPQDCVAVICQYYLKHAFSPICNNLAYFVSVDCLFDLTYNDKFFFALPVSISVYLSEHYFLYFFVKVLILWGIFCMVTRLHDLCFAKMLY